MNVSSAKVGNRKKIFIAAPKIKAVQMLDKPSYGKVFC